MKELIMIRYGELSTKGKNKRKFVATLGRNIREALGEYPEIKINQQHDFMFMELNGALKMRSLIVWKKYLVFKVSHQRSN